MTTAGAAEILREWVAHFRDCEECRRGERDPHMHDEARCEAGAELATDYTAAAAREERRPA